MSLKDEIQYIQKPLLIIWGAKDPHHLVRDAYTMASLIEGSKLAVSPECGHVLMLDDPEFFNQALRSFMETGDPGVKQYTLEEVLGDQG